jgi:MFS family permease
MVQFMLALDTTIVNPALPTIQRDLGFTMSGLAWVVNGCALTAGGLMMFVGLGTSLKLLPRVGVKIGVTISYLTSAVGLLLLSRITLDSHYAADLLPGMLLMAFGQALSFVGLQSWALYKLGNANAGLGSAIQTTSQQLGGSIGLAVLVTVALRHTTSLMGDGVAPPVAATAGYVWVLRLGAAIMVLGAIVVATLFETVPFIPPDKRALKTAEAMAGAPAATS